jgi:hypothetical protein
LTRAAQRNDVILLIALIRDRRILGRGGFESQFQSLSWLPRLNTPLTVPY